jgi:hypothetical protein
MTTNQINHHRTNTSKYSFSQIHQKSPNTHHHISTPSLESFYNNNNNHHHQTNSMNLTRSSFGRNNIRKKQPRTNPNYVNIQIKTPDGTLRSTYIRIDDAQKYQTLTFSSSSSSSPSSSEQNSIICNPQICLNQSNGYFSSDETINTNKINNKQRNEIIKNQKLLLNNDKNQINKTDLMMKQFVTCTDGKNYILL